jgi:CheY-like chemotaxis protein
MPMLPTHRGSALIVDDELSNRVILKSLLKKLGYEVLQADNGAQAVALFEEHRPALIMMDIMMPVMDGYEATLKIKASAGNHFIPIIFLTAITDEAALTRCIDVGGDDYLTKPYSHAVLSAKVQAMERIKYLHDNLHLLYSHMQRDEAIAEQVFSGAVEAENVALELIHTYQKPASVFSGDVLLTAFSPSRDLHVMLGDFTGHGLSAALGALPTSEVFRSMTAKGFQPKQILHAINKKLHGLLPTEMFLAAQFVKVSHNLDYVSVFNCGMPSLYILDNDKHRIKHTIHSNSLPLGILDELGQKEGCEHIEIVPGERILLATDGVAEARNPQGDYFGHDRFKQSIHASQDDDYVLDRIIQELNRFCCNATQDDDITLAEIPLIPELLPQWHSNRRSATMLSVATDTSHQNTQANTTEIQITLRGTQLREANPVPFLINYLQDSADLHVHRQPLFTILTELYVNALDHGVLGLDSSLKETNDGITRYFEQRERMMQALNAGYVRINLTVQPMQRGGHIVIEVEDSGKGFNLKEIQRAQHIDRNYSGRGITLVENLCESLQYFTPGNRVEAMYRWMDLE